MSMTGFQKKFVWRGKGVWGELYQSFFLDFWNCFKFTKPLRICTLCSLLGRTELSAR